MGREQWYFSNVTDWFPLVELVFDPGLGLLVKKDYSIVLSDNRKKVLLTVRLVKFDYDSTARAYWDGNVISWLVKNQRQAT